MKNVPLRLSNYAFMHPFLHHLLQLEICKIHWKNVYFSFMAPFRKLYLASSALSHGSEAKFSFFCTASGLILWKNARRIRYFKSESSCNTCFGRVYVGFRLWLGFILRDAKQPGLPICLQQAGKLTRPVVPKVPNLSQSAHPS